MTVKDNHQMMFLIETEDKLWAKVIFVFQGGYLEHIFTFAAKEASGVLFVEPWQK